MEKMLEYLYYLTPLEYELQISGPQDPQWTIIGRQSNILKRYLKDCSLKDYCVLMIKAFKDNYPNTSGLRVSLLDTDNRKLFLLPDKPLRSDDINRVDFNYAKTKIIGRFDPHKARNLKYLQEYKISFKQAQPQLVAWAIEALLSKPFVQSSAEGKTIISVQQSPILRIETSAKEMSIFIDKSSFIEYSFQIDAYED